MTFLANYPSDLVRTEPVRRCPPTLVQRPLWTLRKRFETTPGRCPQRSARRTGQESDPSVARPDVCSLRAHPQVGHRSLDQAGHRRSGVGRRAGGTRRFRFPVPTERDTGSAISCVHDQITHIRQESILDCANRRDSLWLRSPMPTAWQPDGNRTPVTRGRVPRDRSSWNRLRGPIRSPSWSWTEIVTLPPVRGPRRAAVWTRRAGRMEH